MSEEKRIELFQDVRFSAPGMERSELRTEILRSIAEPWHQVSEKPLIVLARVAAAVSDDVIMFDRRAGDGLPESALTLWPSGNGFRVSNIFPAEVGFLSPTTYNDLLNDFVERVLRRVAWVPIMDIELSERYGVMSDWIGDRAAEMFAAFSDVANKSAAASDQRDRARWLDFIIEVHRSGNSEMLSANRLARWLIEAEEWPEEFAHQLAAEYEASIELLRRYDGLV
ncbi:hypothetical protein R69619_00415 [Paraburkholderia nemoris]|uniref:hypothetical protein n=1 Tax=Paraburkholderia nemoris TaxID=2793076 RepID=UPI00190B6E6A|nr:hypothetical protein [Paraburkholderia nemoris]MBK3737677.1 hypothetical protein [Paraburkholderia aspalathi]CAE6694585.1 hypothetical protein R69619_00415 [Paraburkholderia nemoris]